MISSACQEQCPVLSAALVHMLHACRMLLYLSACDVFNFFLVSMYRMIVMKPEFSVECYSIRWIDPSV